MNVSAIVDQPPAILGGPKAVETDEPDLFNWPIITEEDERAALEVLRAGTMSELDITERFEAEWAEFQQTSFALAQVNGTEALLTAMFACGIGRGDEIICTNMTMWASALPAFSLGATVVFADIDPVTLCIDPGDIEHRITERTRAIVVVHYCGHPCDMDAVMAVARKHDLKVIEDVSHAHGGIYKGRKVGSIGDVSAMSMMSRKAFAVGEGGMLCTDNEEIHERAMAFGHYVRMDRKLTRPELRKFAGMPLGGIKGRMNQMCAAIGRVQLKHYAERMKDMQRGMNRFWDLLEGVGGLRPHRVPADSGCTMGGWYNPLGHYLPEELGGLPASRFAEAVQAECGRSGWGPNTPMNLHPVFNEADIYGDGKPTRIAFADRDVRQPPGSLPVSEALGERTIGMLWFKHDRPELIERYAAAYRKVALQADKLL